MESTPIFIQSKNDLLINKLNYENVIGNISDPNQLKKSTNSIVAIPKSLSNSINLSKQHNPDIKIAKLELGEGLSSIQRKDRKRAINVTADVDLTVTTGNEVIAAVTASILPKILKPLFKSAFDISGDIFGKTSRSSLM